MTLKDKKQDQLLKLLNLSKFGYCGEREAARNRLEKLLDKYDMTYEELEASLQDEKEHAVYMPIEMEFHRRLVTQLCGHIYPDARHYKDEDTDMNYLIAPFSKAIEIELKYYLFKEFLDKEFETTFMALIYKHDIFPQGSVSGNGKTPDEEQMQQVLQKMIIMDTVQVEKQIEGGK